MITMYTAPGCCNCRMAKLRFEQKGIQIMEIDATRSGATVPVEVKSVPAFFVDNVYVGGMECLKNLLSNDPNVLIG